MAKPTMQELARERLKKKAVSELTRSQNISSKLDEKYGHYPPDEEWDKLTRSRREKNVDLPVTTLEEGYLHPETLQTERVPYEGDMFGDYFYYRTGKGQSPFWYGQPPISSSKLRKDLDRYILETKGFQSKKDALELAEAQRGNQSYKHGQTPVFGQGQGYSDFSKRQSRLEEMPEEEYETPVSGQTRVK